MALRWLLAEMSLCLMKMTPSLMKETIMENQIDNYVDQDNLIEMETT